MNDLTFARPEWFWGMLLLLPVLLMRLRSAFAQRRSLSGLVSPRLRHRLVDSGAAGRRWFVFSCRLIAVALLFAALARPQLGFEESQAAETARQLVIAIDTSRSMLAEDVSPNRLERSKLAAIDLVRRLPEDRIALIAFAGRPFLQAPLTIDHDAIVEAIEQFDTDIIPRGGTNLTTATELALEHLGEAGGGEGALIMFSDGEAHEGLEMIEAVAKRAAEAGLAIIGVGVGTPAGSVIPVLGQGGRPVPGEFVKDEDGQIVRTRLDADTLQLLASHRGAYVALGSGAALPRVVDQIRSGIAAARSAAETQRRPMERFLWPLGAAFALLVLSHLSSILFRAPRRRTAPALSKMARPRLAGLGGKKASRGKASIASILVLVAVSAMAAAHAREVEDPFEAAQEAYAAGDYATARSRFEDVLRGRPSSRQRARAQFGLGATAYREGNWERAAELFGQALLHPDRRLREEAHYNLGITLFRSGESLLEGAAADPDGLQALEGPPEWIEGTEELWRNAIEHFQAALELNPGNSLAGHNLKVVERRLEELREEEEQVEETPDDDQDEGEEEEDQPGGDQPDGDQPDGDQPDGDHPDEDHPDEDQPDEDQPDEDQPEGDQPEGDQPDEDQPDEDQPDEDQPDEDQPDGDQPDEDQPDGDQPEGDQSEGDQPDEDQSDGEPQEDEDKGDGEREPGEGDSESSPPDDPEPGDQEGDGEPPDGEIEADGDSPPGTPPSPSSSDAADADSARHPETGYTPDEARQLLEMLADEAQVRPLIQPEHSKPYRDW